MIELLDSFSLRSRDRPTHIQLWSGDITELDPAENVDLLVVSAYPGDYLPTPTSLIGALHNHQVDVAALSTDMSLDARKDLACWTSRELGRPELGFKRIVCFEPLLRGRPSEVVNLLFNSLIAALAAHTDTGTVAMPLLATGDQLTPVGEMLPPLLTEAAFWMSRGLPLTRLMIFVRSREQAEEAIRIFASMKDGLDVMHPPQAPIHDVFISYAREQTNEMVEFRDRISSLVPEIEIFVDQTHLKPGMAWDSELFDSIDKSKVMVPLYSKDYMHSRMCRNEFNFAWARWNARMGELFPVLLYSTELLPQMGRVQYADCRENDPHRVHDAAIQLREHILRFG